MGHINRLNWNLSGPDQHISNWVGIFLFHRSENQFIFMQTTWQAAIHLAQAGGTGIDNSEEPQIALIVDFC